MAPVHLPLSCYQVRPLTFAATAPPLPPGSFVEVGGAANRPFPLRASHRTLTLIAGAAANSCVTMDKSLPLPEPQELLRSQLPFVELL